MAPTPKNYPTVAKPPEIPPAERLPAVKPPTVTPLPRHTHPARRRAGEA